MASVEVKCYATLTQHQPEGGRVDITPGETLGQLADRLAIPRDQVTIRFVNGAHSSWDTALSDNDRVGLFPAVGGG